MEYPTNLEKLNKDSQSQPLVCSGCAHSSAMDVFPGRPSGERPCFFCVRNVQREAWCYEHTRECTGLIKIPKQLEEVPCCHPAHGAWYNGSPAVEFPMDCYHSVDMKHQLEKWIEESKKAK